MKKMKIAYRRLCSGFDWFIQQVENHESQIDCSIEEMTRYIASAQVQLKRVQADGCALTKRVEEVREAMSLWETRARKSKHDDKERAIECLRRRRLSEQELADLVVRQEEHSQFEKQLTKELSQVQADLENMKRQRNVMKTRQSSAKAKVSLSANSVGLSTDVADIFDRWESQIAAYELQSDATGALVDTLEDEFLSAEEREELEAALEELQ